MNSQAAASDLPPATSASKVALAATKTPLPSPRPTRSPVPMPSLKPGEVITWIKLERPSFPLGDIIVNSFAFVGLAILIAVMIGVFLGHLRSGKKETHGAGGLRLR